MNTLQEIENQLPSSYLAALRANKSVEWEFFDPVFEQSSTFILFTPDEVDAYQPDYDSSFAELLAIGSNGGGETYFLHRKEHSVWRADLIAGYGSLVRLFNKFDEILEMRNDPNC